MKNILVTGGAGFIGSHAALILHQKGYTPIILDNLSRGHSELCNDYIFIKGDILNKNDLEGIFREHEVFAVMHFAAFAYVGESCERPEIYFKNNSFGLFNLIEVMVKSDVKRLIFSSTCAVYGNPASLPVNETSSINPTSPYGMSKYICELIINSYFELGKIQPTIFRYFNVIGNDDDLQAYEKHEPETHILPLAIDASIEGTEFTIFGTDYQTQDGTCVRDYLDVRDLISAHIMALNIPKPKKFEDCIFNLGHGIGYSNLEILKTIEYVTNKKIKIKEAARRDGDAVKLFADPTKANKELNWKAKISLEDSIRSRLKLIDANKLS